EAPRREAEDLLPRVEAHPIRVRRAAHRGHAADEWEIRDGLKQISRLKLRCDALSTRGGARAHADREAIASDRQTLQGDRRPVERAGHALDSLPRTDQASPRRQLAHATLL